MQAGINGVMMGNFLTTLGNDPETDRQMFEQRGLNVARQPDNASNPRPDNRSGWLDGETPDVVSALIDAEAGADVQADEAARSDGGLKISEPALSMCGSAPG